MAEVKPGIDGEGDGGEWIPVNVGGQYYRFTVKDRHYGQVLRGDWNPEFIYKETDMVNFDGGLYVCQDANSMGDRPDLSPATWCLIGRKVS